MKLNFISSTFIKFYYGPILPASHSPALYLHPAFAQNTCLLEVMKEMYLHVHINNISIDWTL